MRGALRRLQLRGVSMAWERWQFWYAELLAATGGGAAQRGGRRSTFQEDDEALWLHGEGIEAERASDTPDVEMVAGTGDQEEDQAVPPRPPNWALFDFSRTHLLP